MCFIGARSVLHSVCAAEESVARPKARGSVCLQEELARCEYFIEWPLIKFLACKNLEPSAYYDMG